MQQQSRRGLLKNAAKAAVAVTGGAMITETAKGQVSGTLQKKNYPPKTQAESALSCRGRSALQGHYRGAYEARAR
jgi:2-iminobutanoate/2-iminopropanoate deaminase